MSGTTSEVLAATALAFGFTVFVLLLGSSRRGGFRTIIADAPVIARLLACTFVVIAATGLVILYGGDVMLLPILALGSAVVAAILLVGPLRTARNRERVFYAAALILAAGVAILALIQMAH
jgi:hypothetical protein